MWRSLIRLPVSLGPDRPYDIQFAIEDIILFLLQGNDCRAQNHPFVIINVQRIS